MQLLFKYIEYKIYLNNTPSPSSPHHLRRTWTSAGYLWIVQWIVGTDTLRKHLRWPSTAGGRLVTTGILSWSETVLEGVLEARKKCSDKWFVDKVPLTAGCQLKSHLHRSLPEKTFKPTMFLALKVKTSLVVVSPPGILLSSINSH